MDTWRLWLWRNVAAFFLNKTHSIVVEIVAYAFATAITIKKLVGFSITNWLNLKLSPFNITPSEVDFIVYSCMAVVAYALIAKVMLVVIGHYNGDVPLDSGILRIAKCFLNVKGEDEKEIIALRDNGVPTSQLIEIRRQRADVNVTGLLDTICGQLRESLPGLKEDNVFISVYVTEEPRSQHNKPKKLRLLTHFPRFDNGEIVSPIIDLDAEKFANYESVKCIKNGKSNVLLANCKKYHKSNSDRHKNIRHYIGLPLTGAGVTLGFLNVEISRLCFTSEKELSSFVVKNLLGYRYLLEHELLREHLGELLKQSGVIQPNQQSHGGHP
jgi:hypothetical protein